MKAVVQRVSRASVTIDNKEVSRIKNGLLVLLGISKEDTEKQAKQMAKKIVKLRVMSDQSGKMNLSVADVNGGILVVSQFTLLADTRKGNRPSFIQAARPEQAIPLYELFIEELRKNGVADVQTGKFGAMMKVKLVNDGPVTIIL